jgi:hypothetical protein
MAKGAPKTATAPKTAGTAAMPAPHASAPKSTGAIAATAKGHKGANPADPVGDICLLPEIAGFAHEGRLKQ